MAKEPKPLFDYEPDRWNGVALGLAVGNAVFKLSIIAACWKYLLT